MRKIYTLNLIAGLLLAFMLFSNNVNSQNLVVNGDFETWTDATTPASWTLATNANQESTTIHGGTYSCKHVGGTKNLGQQFAIVAGKTYQFSGWYYVLSGDGSDFRTWSSWKNGTTLLTDNYDVLHPSGYFASAASWQQFSYTIGAPATATDFYLEFRTYSGATVFVDDISFIEVADIAAPVSSVGYPKAMNINATSFDLTTKYDETSTAFYVVLPAGATAPSVAEVLAGTGAAAEVPVQAGSFATGSTEIIKAIEGLTVDVSYDAYIVAQDDETVPNVQTEAAKVSVTTAIPPDAIVMADFASSLAPFTPVSIVGAQVWVQTSGYAKISGYSSGNKDNEDWLISGAINLDASTSNAMKFNSWRNFAGPDMTVLISSNFSGTYDSASVVDAVWTPITATLATTFSVWTESGSIDLSAYSGNIYIAFKYLSTVVGGAPEYRIDDFKVTGYLIPGSDATLSDLTMDAVTITGFDPAIMNYTIELPMGTTTVPVVAYTVTDASATAVITNATDLNGDNAARTTSVAVTAQDGTTVQTYAILFNPIVEAATISVFRNGDATRKYIITGEVLLSYKNASRGQKYLQDATGGIMIDDYSAVITTNYEIGDKITGLTGTKLVYNGLVEFIPLQDPGPAVSSGNAVEPVEITIDQFKNELNSFESKLVTIKNASFVDAGATFASKANYNFTVGETTGVLRTNYADLEYIGAAIPGKADLTGVVIQFNGLAQIVPRSNADFRIISANANLIDLKVNATAVAGFDLAVLNYAVTLPVGTSAIPVITYTTANVNANVVVTNPTNLFGTEAERTASIVVTAENGITVKTYTIVFTVDNTGINYNTGAKLNLYPVPAYNEITISGLAKVNKLELMDITGKVLRKIEITGDEVTVNISDLQKGLYFMRTESQTLKFVKK